LETTPLTPGEHTLVVRRDGYREWKQSVQLRRDQKLEVTLTSAPIAYQSASSADIEIKNSLEGWAQASRNRDIDRHLQYYTDTLDFYYNRTMVPSSKVREDRTRAFAKFNYISVQLSNINIQLDSTGQRATVTLDKTFDFRGDNNAYFNGSVQDLLALTKLGGSWLITGEKELKVYYVNK
jgi:ketosteroid isomerase-like protein